MEEEKNAIDILGFVREACPREIKVKEAELGRAVEAKDLPKCFGLFLETEGECQTCVINRACAEWTRIYSERGIKAPVLPGEPRVQVGQIQPEAEDKEKPKKATRAERKKAEKKEKVAKTKTPQPLANIELDPTWGVQPGDFTVEEGTGRKIFPKGYVNGKIKDMLSKGTTRTNLKNFVAWVGYGEPQLGLTLRILRKEGKLIEKDDGYVKSK